MTTSRIERLWITITGSSVAWGVMAFLATMTVLVTYHELKFDWNAPPLLILQLRIW